ncbi:MAG: hydrolase [Candidatus Bathyarchaeota archaeon]
MMKKRPSPQLISREKTALVIIDVQEKLLQLVSEKEKLVKNIVKLIKFAEIINIPIILTEQYPKGLGLTVKAIRKTLTGVSPIAKTSFNCFASKEFNGWLLKRKISTLMITGIEAHICIFQTALEAVDNFQVCVISDAVASRTKENWQVALERMRQNGVIISSTEMAICELLKDAKTKEFKKSLNLLK